MVSQELSKATGARNLLANQWNQYGHFLAAQAIGKTIVGMLMIDIKHIYEVKAPR